MSKVHLTLACASYDRTRALADGTVQPVGIELTYLALPILDMFKRQIFHREFEASEMSMSNLTMLVSQGRHDFVAIPVFTSKIFRHRSIFVHADAGIERPEDLIGRRVGVPDYTITACLFMRGLLQHEYGVDPTKVRWCWGGLNEPDEEQRVKFQLPAGLELAHVGPDRTLNEMIVGGEIDALMTASLPRAWIERSPKVRRLFPNYKEVERDYYRRTGICPIMHTVVLRSDVYERYRWAARSLYDAFCEAKARCLRDLDEETSRTGELKATLLWLQSAIDEERALFGDDYWPYGLKANRTTLKALVQYSYEQGLSQRQVEVEELFAPELHET